MKSDQESKGPLNKKKNVGQGQTEIWVKKREKRKTKAIKVSCSKINNQ